MQLCVRKMSKNLQWGGIIFAIFSLVGFIAIATSNNSESLTPSPSPAIQAQPSKEPEEITLDKYLTHEELLSVTKDNPENIIGKTYEMSLYLEQQPTNISAEFITQADTNDINTILITCNMQSNDLEKLDGESAQKAIYTKTYPIRVNFKEFNNSAGPYFKADCNLKQ